MKCERRTLAQRGNFKIELCECGAVHLMLGFVTVRLNASAYHELAAAIAEGLRAKQVRDQPTIH